jgi:hypothetical protein
LPRMLAKASCPHYLTVSVTDNNAHICAKAVAINHMDSKFTQY